MTSGDADEAVPCVVLDIPVAPEPASGISALQSMNATDGIPDSCDTAVHEVSQRPSLASLAVAAMIECDSTRGLEPIPSANVQIGQEIKRGRFKTVYKGKYQKRSVVILRYAKENEANELFITGLVAKQQGSSRYIPEVCGVMYEQGMTSVIQELAGWGALKAAMKAPESAKRLSSDHRVHISLQTGKAMVFLHSARVVHADLSCRNVLLFRLEEDPRLCVVKVTDFGLAVDLPEGIDCEYRKQPQATRWCSPETVAESKLSFRSDVWSFGASCWELFAGGSSMPWPRLDKRENVAERLKRLAELAKRLDGDSEANQEALGLIEDDFPMAANCPEAFHDVLRSCLKANEYDRPSFAHINKSISRVAGVEEAESPKFSPGGLMSTPSTTDTAEGYECHRLPLDCTPVFSSPNLIKLKSFLDSPRAIEELGEQAVSTMRREIEVATSVCDRAGTNDSEPLSPPWRRGNSDKFPRLRNSSSAEYFTPLTAATGALVSQGQSPPPPSAGSWTLTSYFSPALMRQDFANEDDARAAFDAAKDDSPCVLRNPVGMKAAANAWAEPQAVVAPNRFGMDASMRSQSPDSPHAGSCCSSPPVPASVLHSTTSLRAVPGMTVSGEVDTLLASTGSLSSIFSSSLPSAGMRTATVRQPAPGKRQLEGTSTLSVNTNLSVRSHTSVASSLSGSANLPKAYTSAGIAVAGRSPPVSSSSFSALRSPVPRQMLQQPPMLHSTPSIAPAMQPRKARSLATPANASLEGLATTGGGYHCRPQPLMIPKGFSTAAAQNCRARGGTLIPASQGLQFRNSIV
jgi:serine/threonine protein kinase